MTPCRQAMAALGSLAVRPQEMPDDGQVVSTLPKQENTLPTNAPPLFRVLSSAAYPFEAGVEVFFVVGMDSDRGRGTGIVAGNDRFFREDCFHFEQDVRSTAFRLCRESPLIPVQRIELLVKRRW